MSDDTKHGLRQRGGTDSNENGLGRIERPKKQGVTVHEYAGSFVWNIPPRVVVYDADGNEVQEGT